MLEQLTELVEGLAALLAAVGLVGHGARNRSTIRQERTFRHVPAHRALSSGKAIDLLPRIVLSETSRAVSRLHVLHCVCSRAEALLTAHRARHVARPVDLHVHVELVLRGERAVTLATLKGRAATVPSTIRATAVPSAATTTAIPVHAALATRQAGALAPLVGAKVGVAEIVTAIAALAAHCCCYCCM